MEEHDDYLDDLEEELLPIKPSPWLRLVALLTVMVFAGMVGVPIWHSFKARLPSAALVADSFRLKEEVDADLLRAIVKIKVQSPDKLVGAAGQTAGTGFNIDGTGLIITNYHVIDNAGRVEVNFPNGKTFKAVSWVGLPAYDLAMIRLAQTDLPALLLQMDLPPQPGDMLTVIGNPVALNQLVVKGRLKGYGVSKAKPTEILIIDVPIYPGNSGSPVLNDQGQVVAVIFGSLRAEEGGEENFYGLAIPIKEVLRLWDEKE